MAEHTDKITIEEDDAALIYFKGTETADTTKNLSTLNGSGTVSGPKDTGGWVFSGMIKIQIKDASENIVERWVPSYIIG